MNEGFLELVHVTCVTSLMLCQRLKIAVSCVEFELHTMACTSGNSNVSGHPTLNLMCPVLLYRKCRYYSRALAADTMCMFM